MFREQHAAYLPTVQAPISFFQLRRHNRLADLGIDQKAISWNNYVALNQKFREKKKKEKTPERTTCTTVMNHTGFYILWTPQHRTVADTV